MSELSFEQMLDESFKTIRNGEVVEGTVIGVKEDDRFFLLTRDWLLKKEIRDWKKLLKIKKY